MARGWREGGERVLRVQSLAFQYLVNSYARLMRGWLRRVSARPLVAGTASPARHRPVHVTSFPQMSIRSRMPPAAGRLAPYSTHILLSKRRHPAVRVREGEDAVKLLGLLLANGGDLNQMVLGMTPIYVAAQNSRVGVVCALRGLVLPAC